MTTYLADEIRVGWYMMPVTHERLMKDRKWVSCAAFLPCPFNEWGPTERPRLPMVEVDGVIQDDGLEWFHRMARWPISREEWMRRRGHANV